MTNTNKILFNTRPEYLTFIHFWKTLATSKEAKAEDYALYALIQGQNLNKAFSKITSKTKLNCNCSGDAYFGIKSVFRSVSYMLRYDKAFAGIWKDAVPEEVKHLLKALVVEYQNDVEDFIEGKYSLDKAKLLAQEYAKTPVKDPTPIKVEKKSLIGKILGK